MVSPKLIGDLFENCPEPSGEIGKERKIVTEEITDVDDDSRDGDEFSFPCTFFDESPISADDAFENGEIRQVFPLFNRDLLFSDAGESKRSLPGSSSSLRPPLRKIFVEETDETTSFEAGGVSEGEYCEWTRKDVEASPEVCKKSNSTGFSKLWRFRDLAFRSNSDGKDAFVFLNHSSKGNEKDRRMGKLEKGETMEENSSGAGKMMKGKGVKSETTSSAAAHERHYVRNRAMNEGHKRKSYLPYRPELVGFFTNVNVMSKNVHPF